MAVYSCTKGHSLYACLFQLDSPGRIVMEYRADNFQTFLLRLMRRPSGTGSDLLIGRIFKQGRNKILLFSILFFWCGLLVNSSRVATSAWCQMNFKVNDFGENHQQRGVLRMLFCVVNPGCKCTCLLTSEKISTNLPTNVFRLNPKPLYIIRK